MKNTQLLWIIARILLILAHVSVYRVNPPGVDKDLEYLDEVLGRELP